MLSEGVCGQQHDDDMMRTHFCVSVYCAWCVSNTTLDERIIWTNQFFAIARSPSSPSWFAHNIRYVRGGRAPYTMATGALNVVRPNSCINHSIIRWARGIHLMCDRARSCYHVTRVCVMWCVSRFWSVGCDVGSICFGACLRGVASRLYHCFGVNIPSDDGESRQRSMTCIYGDRNGWLRVQ